MSSRDESPTVLTKPGSDRSPLDRVVRAFARQVGLLAGVTPLNARAERTRLVEAFSRGHAETPRWRYAAGPARAAASLRREVDRLASELANHPRELVPDQTDGLARLYSARCEEILVELAMLESVGAPKFGALARHRFPNGNAQADTLAHELLDSPEGSVQEDCSSDGDESTSLASRVRALIGELRLPFRVEVHADLVPMAATGDGVVLVAQGRRLSPEAAHRTAMHEVMGHAVPRARASRQALGIFEIGTAGGTDEQEGFALLLEEREGFLRGRRARELGARHEAVRAMRDGASFVEVVERAMRDHGLGANVAVSIAERAFRGGDGVHAGLGREAVYLPAFLRVKAHLSDHPDDETVLSSGQVAVAAVQELRPLVRR